VRFFVGSAARMQLEDRGLRELLHDSGFVSAGLAVLRQRIAPAAEELALRLRTEGAARPDLTGRDLLVLIRMLGSLAPDRPAPPTGEPAGEPDGEFERYLGLVLAGLRRPASGDG
jgi:hypothetical protein